MGGFRSIAVSGLLVALFATPGEAAVRHILLLQSLDRGNLTLDTFTGSFRIEIERRIGEPVIFTQFVVNPSGLGATPERAFVDFLRSAFADGPRPDLVMTVGGTAAAFARKHRQELFPGTPFLLAAVDRRFLEGAPLDDHETAVAVQNDFPQLVDDILGVLPATSTIFVVNDSGPLGQFWRRELQRDFARFEGRVKFVWSNPLTFDQMLKQASALPKDSAILFLTSGSDARGGTYPGERVLAEIHGIANAPLFAAQSAEMGHGIVGGRLIDIDKVVHTAADVAVRLLNGERPAGLRIPVQRTGAGLYDWRELRRWGISESRLPAGSIVRFREPGVWERFRWIILASASVLIAQAALIGALLASRSRRRRAEQALRESEVRFRVLANSAPVLIRMSGVDLRGTDFNLPWLTFTGRALEKELGDGWIEGIHPVDASRYLQIASHALEGRQAFRLEYRLRRADGEYRWLLDSSEPRFTPDGSLLGYISSAIDVTDLKAARAALSSLSGRLIEAQEQERTRLARELHDDVSQRMSFLAMDLARVRAELPDGATEARADIGILYDSALALGRDIQGISHRLHTSKIQYLGLPAAARSFCGEVAARHALKIDYREDGVPSTISEATSINLFRTLQEALSNAVKHSGARHCRVTLRGAPEELTLEVVDDGRGFDLAAALRDQGLGLVTMQERLKLVGGEVVIESKVGGGTAVRARAPLPAPAADPEGARLPPPM